VLDPKKGLNEQVISELAEHSMLICDIANEKWVDLQKSMEKECPAVKRAVYYDNPEQFVTSSYNELAQKLIANYQVVLFANKNHVESGVQAPDKSYIDLSGKELVGVGYYP